MAEEYNKSQEHEYERKTGDYEEGSGAGETKDRGLFDFLGKKAEAKPTSYQHEEKPTSYQHEEKPASYQEEEVIVTEFDEKAKISDHHKAPAPDQYTSSYSKVEEEEDKEKKHENLLQKLHRSNSSSSSSSDEEEDEEKKKKRKEKKGLKDKIKEKISGDDHKEEGYHKEDTAVPVEKVYEEEHHHQAPAPVVHHHEEPTDYPTEEKKGFLEKIKEKLPGHKKTEEVPVAAASYEQQSHDHHAAEPPVVASYEAGEEPKEKKGIMEKIKEKLPGYHSKAEEDHKDIKEKEKDTPSY